MVVEFLAPISAAIASAIGWNVIGVWEKWRNDEEASVDWKKVRKNVIIGSGLGVATFGYAVATGQPEPIINSAQTWFAAVCVYFPLVVIVEKLLGKKKNQDE